MPVIRAAIAFAGLLLISCAGGSPCASCAGCCDSTGACQPGTTVDACGAAGTTCSKCSGSDRCSSSRRTCGPCGAANCSGCCTSDGRCVVELRERDTYCGINGGACVDCTAITKTCSSTAFTCQ